MVSNRGASQGRLFPSRMVHYHPALLGQTLLDLLHWAEGQYGAHQTPVTCRPEEQQGGARWLCKERAAPSSKKSDGHYCRNNQII